MCYNPQYASLYGGAIGALDSRGVFHPGCTGGSATNIWVNGRPVSC